MRTRQSKRGPDTSSRARAIALKKRTTLIDEIQFGGTDGT